MNPVHGPSGDADALTLHNASAVFHPVLTSAAFTAAVLVLLGVLFTLAHLHDVRRGKVEEDA